MGTEEADVFFEARRIQEQPMWYGYDQLTTLFKEDVNELLEGECSLDELMESFRKQREKVFVKSAQ